VQRTLQLLILKTLMRKKHWLQFQNLVTAESFENSTFRKIYMHMARLHGHTTGDINPEIIVGSLEIEYADRTDLLAELRELIYEIQEVELPADDILEFKIKEYVQRSTVFEIATYASKYVYSPELQITVLENLVDRAMEVGDKLDGEVVDFLDASLSGSSDTGSARISLGYTDELDSDLHGGIGVGELTIFLAAPNAGKTSFLCAAGANAATQGHRVLHVSFETHEEKIRRRYDQALTHITRDKLDTRQDLIQQARNVLRNRGGQVWIMDMSHAAVNASEIEAKIRRMWAKDQMVDYLILDYLELMHPNASMSRADTRHIYGMIAKETRALASKLHIPVLTAWQVNRAGSKEDMVSMGDVSESWEIVKHADTIIALNRSKPEVIAHRARLTILKQREDEIKSTRRVYCDLSRMIIRPVGATDDANDAAKDLTRSDDSAGAPSD